MGRINVGRVVVGGLLAGLIVNISEFVLNTYVIGSDMEAALKAMNAPPMTAGQIPMFVVLGFLLGIASVWMYAAIRPRYGAGPATAVKAGLAAWFLGGLLNAAFMWPMGLMPHNLTLISTAVMLVEFPLAAVVGAKFYMESAGMGKGMGAGAGAGMGSRM